MIVSPALLFPLPGRADTSAVVPFADAMSTRLQQLTLHVAPTAAPETPEIVRVTVGPYTFHGHLESSAAPKTCDLFRSLLPHRDKIIQARWSGFAAWIPSPLGDDATMPVLPPENATAVPLPGQILFYPGGISEVEILFPYGPTTFASVAGSLAGNHFLSLTEGTENLEALGKLVQWEGAQDIVFELL